MGTPQQPELRRSGGSAADESSHKLTAGDDVPEEDGGFGKVPEANQPGHHPEHEQDKPDMKLNIPLPTD